jgi:hypothetical protein
MRTQPAPSPEKHQQQQPPPLAKHLPSPPPPPPRAGTTKTINGKTYRRVGGGWRKVEDGVTDSADSADSAAAAAPAAAAPTTVPPAATTVSTTASQAASLHQRWPSRPSISRPSSRDDTGKVGGEGRRQGEEHGPGGATPRPRDRSRERPTTGPRAGSEPARSVGCVGGAPDSACVVAKQVSAACVAPSRDVSVRW